jgi:hypothetical protein
MGITRRSRGGSGTRRWMGGVAGVAVLAGGLAACVPPTAPVPACPARATVVLESPDPVAFSLPRAVSPDGTWVALSRVVDDQMVISVRRTEAEAPSQQIGSLALDELVGGQPRVAVAANGTRVLWAGNVTAPLPDQPTSSLSRWVLSGGVETVTPPAAASPPAGTPYPVNLRALSADGERAVWTQAFYQGNSAFLHVRSITHTGTDQIISQQVLEDTPGSTYSTGARTETLTTPDADGEYAVIDLETFAATSLTPALAAAEAAFPGEAFRPMVSSDDGRWTVLRQRTPNPAPYALWLHVLWDHATEQVSLISQAPGVWIDSVDDGGTVVYALDNGTTIRSVHRSADGTERTVADAPMLDPSIDEGTRPLTSVDRRTTLYSEPLLALGNRLVARRCN